MEHTQICIKKAHHAEQMRHVQHVYEIAVPVGSSYLLMEFGEVPNKLTWTSFALLLRASFVVQNQA